MESTLMSCPTCSHSLSNMAGACAYCGAKIKVQQPQSDEDNIVDPAPVAKSPPSWPQEVASPADVIRAETDETDAVVDLQPETDTSQQFPESQVDAKKSEATAKPEAVSAKEPAVDGEDAESTLFDGVQSLDYQSEIIQLPADKVGSFEITSSEIVGSEPDPKTDSEPAAAEKLDIQEPQNEIISVVDDVVEASQEEAATLSVADAMQSPPEPEVVDLVGDEPGESETLEEDLIDLVEIEAAQKESGNLAIPDVILSSDESVEEASVHSDEATPPKNEPDVAANAAHGFIPESTGETIFLDIADEVQLPAGEPPEKIEKEARPQTPTEAFKIEKAAQDTAVATDQQKAELDEAQKKKRQKIALAKAQAVKKQKEALAKARAQKRQKMIMAKDAALKRKKAVQAKSQALKKQVPAAKNTAATDKPKVVQILETKTRMQGLLEKYKGQAIGINYDNSAEILEAQLVDANNEFFSVLAENKNLCYTYPIKSILTVIEGQDGVEVGKFKEKVKFNVIIKVYPLVLF